MPAMSALTLATRVYNPTGTADGLSTWRYPEDVIFKSTSLVNESVRGPSRDGMYRVNFKVDTPRAKGEDSACGCAGTVIDRAVTRVETIYPAAWTESMRAEHWARVKALVASSIATAGNEKLEGSW